MSLLKRAFLLIEHSRDTLPVGDVYDLHHQNCVQLMETVQSFLEIEGHSATLTIGLERVTEETYKTFDCVIIHPSHDDMGKLCRLRALHPHVRLVISPGDSSQSARNESYKKLERDCEGVYILYKGYGVEELLEAIAPASEVQRL